MPLISPDGLDQVIKFVERFDSNESRAVQEILKKANWKKSKEIKTYMLVIPFDEISSGKTEPLALKIQNLLDVLSDGKEPVMSTTPHKTKLFVFQSEKSFAAIQDEARLALHEHHRLIIEISAIAASTYFSSKGTAKIIKMITGSL